MFIMVRETVRFRPYNQVAYDQFPYSTASINNVFQLQDHFDKRYEAKQFRLQSPYSSFEILRRLAVASIFA